ncbi:MAG: hypothetical protein LEGION0398_MBIBDBAK_01187 [Legionellaceae bacterium]
MYNILSDLEINEQKKCGVNNKFYDEELVKFNEFWPKNETDFTKNMTNFSIAYAIKIIARVKSILSVSEVRANINIDTGRLSCQRTNSKNNSATKYTFNLIGRETVKAKYLWTALVFLVDTLPYEIDYSCINNFVDTFDEKKELGKWFSLFSKNSLYEMEFKKHIDRNFIEIFLDIKNSDKQINNTIFVDKQEENCDLKMLESKYQTIDFVIYPYKKIKVTTEESNYEDEFGIDHKQTINRQDDLWSWHLDYKMSEYKPSYQAKLNVYSGTLILEPIEQSNYNLILYYHLFSSSENLKKYAITLFRLQYEAGYLINDNLEKKYKKNESSFANGYLDYIVPIKIDDLPYDRTFPGDGKVTYHSAFYESVYRYTYTPGPDDRMWIDKKNKSYLDYLIKKKNQYGNLNSIENAALKREEKNYPDLAKTLIQKCTPIVKGRLENEDKKREEEKKIKAKSIEEKHIKETNQKIQNEKNKILKLNSSLHDLFSPHNFNERKPLLLLKYLNEGAKIDYQGQDGNTALILTVGIRDEDLTYILLKNGANPLLTNKDGCKASDLICPTNPIYITLKKYELLFAARTNNLSAVQSVCHDKEINVNEVIDATDGNGCSALMIAVCENYIEIVKFLLSQNANLNLKDNSGNNVFALVENNEIHNLLKEVAFNASNALDLKDEDEKDIYDDTFQLTDKPYGFFTPILSQELDNSNSPIRKNEPKYN